jgi:tetratricopeptide (TPR) repeat protein
MESGSTITDELSWLERSCHGETLPPSAEHCLHMAAKSYGDDIEAERYLHQALAMAPEHAAVYIAFYRFYFYRNRVRQALPYAELCLGLAARALKLNHDWRQVQREDASFGDYAAFAPRFFLFSLKAWGYLKLRLGELEDGRLAVEKVTQLDPADKVGAAVLLDVLNRMGQDDDD